MKIVLATDLSEGSEPAARWTFDYAKALDQLGISVDLTVLHALHSRYPQILDESVRLQDEENLKRLRGEVTGWIHASVDDPSVEFDAEVLPGEPDDVLRSWATENEADWITVGMTGRGALERLVVGSTSERLAHGPPCNLAICHPDHGRLVEKPTLVAGVDFTDASTAGLTLASELAHQIDAKLQVIHVVEPPTYEAYPFDHFGEGEIRDMNHLVETMNRELDNLVDEHAAKLEGIEWTSQVLTGYPTQELKRFADEEEADGIVLGTVGRSSVGDFLMGSVSRGLVKHMPCSVFLAPPVP